MKHLGTKELKTERLSLRRFELSDAETMFRNWASDPEVTKFLSWPTHTDVTVSERVLAEWLPNYERDDYYHWAIVPESAGEAVGSIGPVLQRDDIKMVHIGYCIGSKWWCQGITSEALAALIKFFFEEVGMNRIESRHDPNNPNSGKVMMKCGMVCEGTMRQADINNQGIVDYSIYSILAEDYFEKII
ncbi:MAG: GNAT family N-acetyltransferase [Oscillospiraceae bacterium]|jgi:ribosomal-protein-alanine N-acetyltransferase|nr:GNAT family N-acetyltransferase [Oscillospiraceae bacterium]